MPKEKRPLTGDDRLVQAGVIAYAVAGAKHVPMLLADKVVIDCHEEQMWAFVDLTGEKWEEVRLADVNALLTTGGRPN